MEFMSCIPGSVGGGIKMNSGCFESEFKDILISVQCIDFDGTLKMINKKISSLSIEVQIYQKI